MPIDFKPDGDASSVIDFKPDSSDGINFKPDGGAVQNMNRTGDTQPSMRALTPYERYVEPITHAIKEAIVGPETQPMIGVRGVLPVASQVLYGNVKPDASKGVGVLNFSPGTLMPEPQNELQGVNKGILDQVNVQNLLFLKLLGPLIGATGIGANLLKAGTAAYLSAEGAKGAGQAAGERFSGTQQPGQKGELDVNMVLSALQAAGSPLIAAPESALRSVANKLPEDAWYAEPKYQLQPPGARFEVGPRGSVSTFDKLNPTPDYEQIKTTDPLEIETKSQEQQKTVQQTGESGKEPPQSASNVQGEVRQGADATAQGRLLSGPDLNINTVDVFAGLRTKGFTNKNAFSLALKDWMKQMGVTPSNNHIAIEMFARSLHNGEKSAVDLYKKYDYPTGDFPIVVDDESAPSSKKSLTLIKKVNPVPPEGQPGYGTPGNVSFTDPRTAFTVEELPPDTTEEVAQGMLQKKIRHDLVPAIATDNGIIKATSDEQLSHDDVLKANKIEPAAIRHEDPRRGFVDSMGNWYTRKQAEEVTGIKGTAEAGGLDSMDLPRASYEKGAEKENWKAAQLAYERAYGDKLYSGLGPLFDPDFWKEAIKIPGQVKTDGQMLYNRMRNALGKDSATWKAVDTEAFRKLVMGAGRISPDEVKGYLERTGPKVEVKKFRQGAAQTPEQKRFFQLEHLIDSHPQKKQIDRVIQENDGPGSARYDELDDSAKRLVDEYIPLNKKELHKDVNYESHWQFIAPKPESSMPGYTEIAVVKPLARDKSVTTEHLPEGKSVEQFPSSHSFPPNTLGFARGYMETTPEGKKVFHVIEVQSDWAQQLREAKEHHRPGFDESLGVAQEPLLQHYERLALKAAIEHARSQGADAIAISDAETAMMTQGHDRLQREPDRMQPPQNEGMRLHYDRTLPKIAEELTGEKGKRVEFGTHKSAFEPRTDIQGINFKTEEEARRYAGPNGIVTRVGTEWEGLKTSPRKNLIFKTPEGQPKTSVSARLYPISKARENFSLFGSDKPKPLTVAEVIPQITGGGKMFSGVPIFDPELLGISPERAAELKEKYLKMLAAKGQSIASDLASAPKQFASKSARAAAILGSTTARPMERTQELIAQPGEKLGVGERAGNLARRIAQVAGEADKVVNPWDVLYDWMDGGKAKYNGPLMENIRKPLDADFNDELNLRSQLLEPIRDLIKKNKMGKEQSQRIGVYLNTLQEGGRDRMIASGIQPEIIAKIEKTITPQEKAVAQSIRQMYDQTFPLIQKVAKDVDGIELNPVDNYFSWEREWRKYKPDADELASPKVPAKGATVDDVLWPGLDAVRTRTKPGSIEKRVPGAATPIKIDAFEIVDRYVRDASHYIAMRRHLKEISEIVRSDEFRSKYGEMGQDLIMEHLNTIARQGRYKRNGFLDGLRKLTSRGVIAFRLPSQFVHLANIPLGMQRAGVARWYKGLDEALSDEGQIFLKKNFAETFERGGGEPALREVAEGNLGKQSVYNKVSQAGFWLQRRIDQLNAQATVIGVYMRELEKKGKNAEDYAELPVDKAAVEQARVEARRAVASPLYKDVPPLLNRGGSLTKSLMQFQNTFLDQWSNIRYDLAQVGVPEAFKGNPKLAFQMTAALAAMLLVETAVKYGYKQGLNKATGAKQREGDTFENTLEHEALRRIPGMGQLQSEIVYGETGIPSIDALEEPIKQGVKYAKATDSSSKILAATRGAGAVAEVAGIPGASQATDVVGGVERAKLFKSHTQRLEEQESGKNVEKMTLKERYTAEQRYKKTEKPMSKMEQASAAERSISNIAKRGEEVAKELDKPMRNWVESRGLTIPGYDNKLKIGKEDIYLDDNELQRLHGYIKDEYVSAITQLRTRESRFDKLPTDEQKVYFNEALIAARSRARFKLMQEMSRSQNERDKEKTKSKKFSIFNND